MSVKVTTKNAKKAFGDLAKHLGAAARRALLAAAMRAVQEIQVTIIPSKVPQPMDRGVYRAGWRAEPLPNGALVVNREKHAAMIEHGVRAGNVKPGRAMLGALAAWAVRKGIASDIEDGHRIAFAIANRMKQHGIFNGGTGFGILKAAVEKLPQWIREEMLREMNRSAR